MTEFLLAILVFIAAHVLPVRTGLRAWGIERFGRAAYVGAYSILSLALVVWVLAAYGRAPYLPLWPPAPWQALVPLLLMPLALALFAVGAAIANPLSVSFRKALPGSGLHPFYRLVRHPVLWGFGLWALAHLAPNGDLASLILFGGFALFAFAGMSVFDRRKRRQFGHQEWQALAGGDAAWRALPFSRRIAMAADRPVMPGIAAGLIVYALLLAGGHEHAFGVDPLVALT